MALNEIQKCLLKEFNRQRLKSNTIGFVMKTLTNDEQQNSFLNYMIDNRNVLLTEYDVFNKLNELIER